MQEDILKNVSLFFVHAMKIIGSNHNLDTTDFHWMDKIYLFSNLADAFIQSDLQMRTL